MSEQVKSEKARTEAASAGIEASNLAFAYGSTPVFSNVNFSIPAGQVWALVGRSGIGKSTLLNVVLGLFQSTGGYVCTRYGTVTRPARIRGAVFQEESLLWWHTVMENVVRFHPARRRRDTFEKARHLLKEAGLSDLEQRHPKELSTGMRKRVELVRALFIDDEFFVADEPFTALDVQTRMEIYSVWDRLIAENPLTGIICTHDPIEAATLCDAVMVMQRKIKEPATSAIVKIPDELRAKADPIRSAAFNDFVAVVVGMMK